MNMILISVSLTGCSQFFQNTVNLDLTFQRPLCMPESISCIFLILRDSVGGHQPIEKNFECCVNQPVDNLAVVLIALHLQC